MNLITHIYMPRKGHVQYRWKGSVVQGLPKISYLIQDEYLFDDTITNNIMIANPSLPEEDFKEIVRECHLAEVLKNHSGTIGENGSHLSGGEYFLRERLLIHRQIYTFLMSYLLHLMKEPFSRFL